MGWSGSLTHLGGHCELDALRTVPSKNGGFTAMYDAHSPFVSMGNMTIIQRSLWMFMAITV